MLSHHKSKLLTFVSGALAATIGVRFLKSKIAHKFAVRSVAEGLKLKSEVLCKYEKIREEAQDIYEEARRESEQGESGCAKGDK
ncbi:hypothetical protein R83H12_00616 [Fibrobacteria bacterium R8-3-H12]